MHYMTVEGYPLPALFGGHPALELCNTWSGWSDPPDLTGSFDPRREYLADADRLAVWLGHVGLADAATVSQLRRAMVQRPDEARSVLHDVRVLRSAAYPLLRGSNADTTPVIARYADRAAASSRLRRGADGRFARVVVGDGPIRALHAAAAAVEDLLTQLTVTVRACPGEDCGWLFLDRTGRRKWCSMTSCGNRAKVRAHERRRKAHR